MESNNVIQAAQPQTQPQTTQQPQTLSALIKSPAVKERFAEVLKTKGDSFLASVLTTVSNSALLQKA